MKNIIYTFLFSIFLFCSGSINRNIQKEKTDIELLKELAFCKCLEHSLDTFSKVDTLEMGSGEVLNLMDTKGLFSNIVQPIFDSLALSIEPVWVFFLFLRIRQ